MKVRRPHVQQPEAQVLPGVAIWPNVAGSPPIGRRPRQVPRQVLAVMLEEGIPWEDSDDDEPQAEPSAGAEPSHRGGSTEAADWVQDTGTSVENCGPSAPWRRRRLRSAEPGFREPPPDLALLRGKHIHAPRVERGVHR